MSTSVSTVPESRASYTEPRAPDVPMVKAASPLARAKKWSAPEGLRPTLKTRSLSTISRIQVKMSTMVALSTVAASARASRPLVLSTRVWSAIEDHCSGYQGWTSRDMACSAAPARTISSPISYISSRVAGGASGSRPAAMKSLRS